MNKDKKIVLAIHYEHDATVVLLRDGEILESMGEERLSRQKKHAGFPHLALDYIKTKYNIFTFDKVIIVGNPNFSFGTISLTKEDNEKIRQNKSIPKRYLRSLGFRFPTLGKIFSIRDFVLVKLRTLNKKSSTSSYLRNIFPESEIEYIDHHLAHAYAAIPFMSNHEKRVVLTCDGAGDGLCATVNIYENGKMETLAKTSFDNSLGLLYCAVVDLLGMSRNEHEFKVMGLAPYAKVSSGEKVYDKLKELVFYDEESMTLKSRFPLQRATEYLIANEYFNYRFDSLAYGIQKLTENILTEMSRHVLNKFQVSNLAIGGGVFMNVKANQKILALDKVKDFTVSPSSGDESLAIGAAVYGYIKYYGYKEIKQVKNIYWGSEYTDIQIKKAIDDYKYEGKYEDGTTISASSIKVEYFDEMNEIKIEKKVAEILAGNNVIGRFSGRAEWGARALGNRSILANPSSMNNVKLINEMIKNRDFWMPFATSIMYEEGEKYLHNEKMKLSPYMAITFETKPLAEKNIIAALHPYDLTSRPQTVTKEANEKYWNIINEFKNITDIGGILNTSFNLHGEPNVENPYDAIRTFDLSGMKYLAIGNYLLSKEK